MKIIAYKCTECKKVFASKEKYASHMKREEALKEIAEKYPKVKEATSDFSNGKYPVQRSKEWFEGYKSLVLAKIKDAGDGGNYEPMSYGFFRCLDDSESMFYGVACRIWRVCPKCYKEWGQQYFTDICC